MMSNDRRWRRTLEGSLGIPATEGNVVEVLRDGVNIFPAMLDAIESATRTVDLLTFVYWRGDIAWRFSAALSERAASGVRCRVILDALGARLVDDDLIARMEEAGVLIHWFRPLADGDGLHHPGYRTHRKVLVCDEEVAFTGGIGIAEEWDGSSDDGTGWRETQLRVRGPVVDGLRAAFLDDWLDSGQDLLDDRDRFPDQPRDGTTTALVIRGASEHGRSDIAMLRQLLFSEVEERLRITTPYFAPDAVVLETLLAAARRGVQVQLLVPGGNNDKEVAQLATERLYRRLLDAGIEIHVFTPTMLHAKVITVDSSLAVVGSANLNHRSLQHDEEVDVVLFDEDVVAELDEHTDADLARCHRVTVEDLDAAAQAARSPLQALTGLIARWT
jgi:cardiolipin synthase A/B